MQPPVEDEKDSFNTREPRKGPSSLPLWTLVGILLFLMAALQSLCSSATNKNSSNNSKNKPERVDVKRSLPPVKQNEGKEETQSSSTSTSSSQQTERKTQQLDKESQKRHRKPAGFGSFSVLETVPHDTKAFTQGLLVWTDRHNRTIMVEGTGNHGESELRRLDPRTGKVLQTHRMPNEYFGEGVAHYKNKTTDRDCLIQLTWQERVAVIYDAETFEVLSNFRFRTKRNEGWGITHDAKNDRFIVSDGSEFLHFWDATYKETDRIKVTFLGQGTSKPIEVGGINELEWDSYNSGTVLANVWGQDIIIRIDPTTGHITTVYQLHGLYTNRHKSTDVFNGIALTDTPNQVWVTGKWWPYMYRIQLIEP